MHMRLRMFDTYKGLPKNMYIMFGITIINRFGDFVMPFLTMYLTSKLGLTYQIAGIIVTICSLSGIPASFIGGKFADELGRKKTYLIAQVGTALSLLPCAFLKNPVLIVSFLMLSTFFRGAVRPAMNAIVTDILPPHQRKQGFSLQYLGINLGVALGPMVSGFLFENYLPLLFIGDATSSLIAVVLVWKNIKDIRPEKLKETAYTEAEKEEKGNIITALVKRPQIAVFLLINILYTFVYAQCSFSLPLTADYVFGEAGASKYGLLISINAITVLTCTVAVTSLTKNLKSITNIAIAGLFYAVGFGMLGYINSFPMFILSTIIWTIGEILVVTNNGVYMADNSPSNFRARFNAVSSLSWSIGSSLGTTIAGKVIQELGLKPFWNLTLILSVAGMVGMLALTLFGKKKETTLEAAMEQETL